MLSWDTILRRSHAHPVRVPRPVCLGTLPKRRGPGHGAGLRHPFRSGGPARHGLHQPGPGDPDRPGCAEAGRLGGGCGHRRRRGPGPDGTDRQRHRRRPVRHRLGCQDPEAPRPQRQWPVSEVAHPGPFQAAGPDAHPGPRAPARQRARLRGRLVRAAREVRQAAHGPGAGAGHPLRQGGLPRQRAGRLLLGAQRARPGPLPGLPGDLHGGRQAGPEERRGVPQSPAGGHPRAARKGRPGRLLQGRDSPEDRQLHAGPGRLPQRRGSGRPPFGLGGAGEREVSRVRRVGAAPQRPGHCGPADAQHSRRLRFLQDPLRQPPPCAPVHRSQEAGLRRSREVLRGRRLHEGAPGLAAVQGVRGPAPGPHQRHPRRPPPGGGPSAPEGGRHRLPHHGRWRGQHGEPDPEQLPGHGQRHDAGRPGLLPPGPRRAVRPGGGQRQHLRTGQAPLPHHHSGLHHQGRRALPELRRHGRGMPAPGPRRRS